MPDSCSLAGCTNSGTKGGMIRYFRLPRVIENQGEEIKRLSSVWRAKWVGIIKVKKPDWEPGKHSSICSFHFVSGKRADLADVNNPDWVPSLLLGTGMEDKGQESKTLTQIRSLVAEKKTKKVWTQTRKSLRKLSEKRVNLSVLYPTQKRWEDVKDALSLENDDAVANYLLDLFEDGPSHNSSSSDPSSADISVQDSKSSPQSTLHQSSPPVVTLDMACEDTVGMVERDKTTQLPSSQLTDNSDVAETMDSQEDVHDEMSSSTSATMATDTIATNDDIIEIPLTPKNTIIKTENLDISESEDDFNLDNDSTFAPETAVVDICKARPATSVAETVSDACEAKTAVSAPETDVLDMAKAKPTTSASETAMLKSTNIEPRTSTRESVLCGSDDGASPTEKGGEKFAEKNEKVKLVWTHPHVSSSSSAKEPSQVEMKQAHQMRNGANKSTATEGNRKQKELGQLVSDRFLRKVHFQCNKCHKRYTDPQKLETHKLDMHGQVDKFKCPHCCLTYKNQMGLTRHLFRDHPEYRKRAAFKTLMYDKQNADDVSVDVDVTPRKVHFKCNRCHKRSTDPQKLEAHKLEIHGQADKFKCPHCCLTYRKKRGLSRHLFRDHREHQTREDVNARRYDSNLYYQCDFCSRRFHTTDSLNKHQTELHVANLDGTMTHKGYSCEKCNALYKTQAALTAHISQFCQLWKNVLRVTKLSCTQCDENFKNSYFLKKHVKNVHSKKAKSGTIAVSKESTNKEGVTVCACGEVLAGKDTIHYNCTERKKCPHCEMSYKASNTLKEHIDAVHSGKPQEFVCKICHKSYPRRRYLKQHETIHVLGDKRFRYKCKFCSKVYTSRQTVREHELKHRGVRSLCNICGKGFATPTILNTHLRIHRNVRTHQCPYCDKAFFDGYKMRCHMNSHTGEKPHKCRYCDKYFGFTSARSLHQRTQHPAEYEAERNERVKVDEVKLLSAEEMEGPLPEPEEDPLVLELQRLSKELETGDAVNPSGDN